MQEKKSYTQEVESIHSNIFYADAVMTPCGCGQIGNPWQRMMINNLLAVIASPAECDSVCSD